MAITTQAGVNSALPGQTMVFQKTGILNTFAKFISCWTDAGSPGQGASPSSGLAGDVPTKSTTGAYNYVNPASGNTYVGRVATGIPQGGNMTLGFFLYDRLWQNSGIDVTITTAQTVNSVALTRPDANGTDAEVWWEVYATMGSGTPTVTLSYTNSSGTASQSASSGALATGMSAQLAGQFTLASGDTGVKSVQTWTANATFTSGTIGLVIRRLVTFLMLPSGAPTIVFDALACGLPRVYDSACLEVLFYAGTSSWTITGPIAISLIQG